MRIRISYPSGDQMVIVGDWKGPQFVGPDLVPVIHVKEPVRLKEGGFLNRGEVLIGDPRGVYQDADSGAVLYNPRHAIISALLSAGWREWLDENPEWPGVLEIDGLEEVMPTPVESHDEAPGALPNGTLVEKINTEPDDQHPDGALAHVIGSAGSKEHGFVYCVAWEDFPGLPVWIAGHRVTKSRK